MVAEAVFYLPMFASSRMTATPSAKNDDQNKGASFAEKTGLKPGVQKPRAAASAARRAGSAPPPGQAAEMHHIGTPHRERSRPRESGDTPEDGQVRKPRRILPPVAPGTPIEQQLSDLRDAVGRWMEHLDVQTQEHHSRLADIDVKQDWFYEQLQEANRTGELDKLLT